MSETWIIFSEYFCSEKFSPHRLKSITSFIADPSATREVATTQLFYMIDIRKAVKQHRTGFQVWIVEYKMCEAAMYVIIFHMTCVLSQTVQKYFNTIYVVQFNTYSNYVLYVAHIVLSFLIDRRLTPPYLLRVSQLFPGDQTSVSNKIS